MLKGKEIQFNLDDRTVQSPDACKVKRGVFVGLAEDGSLILQSSDGVQTMHAGEIIPLAPQRNWQSLSLQCAVSVLCSGVVIQSIREQSGLAEAMHDGLQMLGAINAVALSGRLAINLPFSPVPVTAQTLCINLLALFLGSKQAAIAMALFAAGVCVMDLPWGSPKGGKVSRGYIFGFIPAAYIYGLPTLWARQNVTVAKLMMNAGLASAVIYSCGLAGLVAYGVSNPFRVGVLPFLPGDAAKSLTAAMVFKYMLVK